MSCLPIPVKTDHRGTFSVLYFDTEERAMQYAAYATRDNRPDVCKPVKFDGPKNGRAGWMDEKNPQGIRVLFAVMTGGT